MNGGGVQRMNSNPAWGGKRDDRRRFLALTQVRRELDGFHFLDEIGRGGSAVIYRARETALDRLVAIKIVMPEPGPRSQELSDLFLKEAQAIARLDHPNIIQVHSAGRTGNVFYLILQYVEGETLDRVLAREGRISPDRAVGIAREVAAALGAAHAKGVIHRDIKPSNVMVGLGERIKVMDFGIAGGQFRADETGRHAVFIGTPIYSSPEQCRMEPLDGRSDLYSLGVVLYQMLSGSVPHVAASPEETIDRVAASEPAPIDYLVSDLSRDVHALVGRLLARERDNRFPDAASAVEEMDRIRAAGAFFRSGARARASRSSGSSRSAPAAPRFRASAFSAVVLAFAVLVTLVALAGGRMLPGENPDEPAAGLEKREVSACVVVAPALVNPALDPTGTRQVERETLAAFADIEGISARTGTWLESRTGSAGAGEAFVDSAARELAGQTAFVAQGSLRPEGERVFLDLVLVELSTRERVIQVAGSAPADRLGELAARIAQTTARRLAEWLVRDPARRGVEPAVWIDLDDAPAQGRITPYQG
ncbi:MAG: serine/threonine protein kinase [Planctomycetes bacterium]|nr:serine/threonine protein kinase [Planctomycetota bacterium]